MILVLELQDGVVRKFTLVGCSSSLSNIAHHPTHAVLDLGCTRSTGSMSARDFQKHARCNCITTECCRCNNSFVFTLFTFQQHQHIETWLMCLRQVMYLFCFRLAQIIPAQLMRKAATVGNTQITSSGKTPKELAMG